MRLQHVSIAYASLSSLAYASTSEELLSFLQANPGQTSVASTDEEFLEWKSRVETTDTPISPVVPKAYIIQLKPGSSLTKRDQDEHSQFHKRASTIDYSTRREFKTPDLFFGLSIQVNDDTNETTILEIPDVLKVWPLKIIPRPPILELSEFPEILEPASVVETAVVEIPGNLSAIAGPGANTNSPHRQTEVDRLHALGIKGKGVKIAVMDTGIDYRHPALGGGFGPGFKVSFGKSFVTDDSDEESNDPLATCVSGGHGTHVAGIIGMQDPANSTFGLVGVAPEAELGAYRVFGCSGGAPEDVLMRAFEQAAIDEVDILSSSLGSTRPWETDDPYSIITAGLEARGIAVVVAIGNNGRSLPATPGSPAVGQKVIAVGSIANSHYPTVYSGKDSRGRSFKYSGSPFPLQAPAAGLIVIDFATLAANSTSPSGCLVAGWKTLNESIINKEETIVAVPFTTECTLSVIVQNSQNYGFPRTVLYVKGARVDVYFQDYQAFILNLPYQAITLNQVDSETLIEGLALSGSNKYRLFFNSGVFESRSQLTGGFMSNFSSWGPTLDTLAIKPQMSAPGGSILSTWPLLGRGYGIMSGTSMATPYVAGALALLKSQFPDATVQQLRERLQSTSQPVQYIYEQSLRTSIAQQGGGMINVYKAMFYESTVSPSELNLGDLDNLTAPREITIDNFSNRSKTYEISHEPAGLVNVVPYNSSSTGALWGQNFFGSQYPFYASVKLSETTVTIPAGSSANITVSFDPPQDMDPLFLPVYSGFIRIKNNNNNDYDDDDLRVLYLGQPYSRFNASYLDTSSKSGVEWPGLFTYSTPNILTRVNNGIANFSFGRQGFGAPALQWMTQQNTQGYRIDMVPYNTTFVPDHYGFTSNASNPLGAPDAFLPLRYPDLAINGTAAGAEIFGMAKSDRQLRRGSTMLILLDGSTYDAGGGLVATLPDGDYRALLRVLKWGGDWAKEESYESWLSPIIRGTRRP
ncbi:hypothetical protein LZ554_006732 [Drepanopeziza brunnea f. sp. 'monogermtubi']|nr:hypothetical protein LZ554_006732 [Drepanopeziza brunnea f. sp. 'monogermtubi']